MKKILYTLFILIPSILFAQPLQFELEPEAFPAEINGWQMYSPWAGGMDATTPELCDLDSDGDYDFFTGSEINWYWYFENIGNSASPSFKYVSSYFDSLYPFSLTGVYSSIDFCDIDADGDFDAFLCNGSIGLAINQGNNSQYNFAPTDSLFDQNGQLLYGTHVAAADIDADGDYDLFGGNSYAGNFGYFENRGTPQDYDFYLITPSWQNIQVSGGYADPCFADLDADGDLDLLVGTGEGKIYYYENQGSAQIPQMVYVTDYFNYIDVGEDASPELADIDDDGDLDLLVGRDALYYASPFIQGDVFFYENVGTPQNYSFQLVTTNYITFDNINFNRPNLVDIDADEDQDLLTVIDSHVLFYRNQGTIGNPSFVYETSTFCGITVPSISPWFCDIDADRDYDLFCGTAVIPGPPGLYLFMNQGTPQNPSYTLYSNNVVPGVFTQASAIINAVTADIDADGDWDLFASDMTGHLYFWENVGTPTQFQFQYQTNNWQNIYIGLNQNRFFHFYDIDGDGDLDLFYALISATSEWTLGFYRNEGTPQNANMVLESEDVFPELYIIEPAPYVIDIDGDRDGDLFVGDGYGGIRFFRNLEFTPQPVTLTLTPHNPPIQIPPGGGSFQFDLEIVNADTIDYTIDAWTDVTLPGGSIFPILLRENISLPIGGSIIREDLTQFIPDRAPSGNYSYNAHVRNHITLEVLAEDSFSFEKMPGCDVSAHDLGWGLYGWEDAQASLSSTLPGEFALLLAYPNPFNTSTTIRFELPEASRVKLVVYNTSGQVVAILIDKQLSTGSYTTIWDAEGLASGVYLVALEAGNNFSLARKVMLVK